MTTIPPSDAERQDAIADASQQGAPQQARAAGRRGDEDGPAVERPRHRVLRVVATALAALLALYLVGGTAAAFAIKGRSFARVATVGVATTYGTYDDWRAQAGERSQVEFESGANELTGWVYGAGNDLGLVVLVHAFGSCADRYLDVIAWFVQHGWRVLAYNGSGVEPSGGDSRQSLVQTVADLRSALAFVADDPDLKTLPLALWGHSQGGYAVTAALAFPEAERVRAAVSVSGFNNPSSIALDVIHDELGWPAYAVRPFTYLADWPDLAPDAPTAVKGINATSAAVLLVQGTADQLVDPKRYATTHFAGSIKNKAVAVIKWDVPKQRGHSTLLYSLAALKYRDQAAAADFETCLKRAKQPASQTAGAACQAKTGYDPLKANQLNADLFDQMEDFLDAGVG
ncbi:MAG: lysophospholipase [Propionibacteriaceae bacterium]|jgi:alpha-beta hydrolase superfamily lysophospholipase|nr:lysophospholipase [Propionibacteriaceae bacterium]